MDDQCMSRCAKKKACDTAWISFVPPFVNMPFQKKSDKQAGKQLKIWRWVQLLIWVQILITELHGINILKKKKKRKKKQHTKKMEEGKV